MTNSFNYLRAPDSDGMFDSNYQRQSQNLKQITDSSLKDLDAALKNQETDNTKFLEGIKSFSTGVDELLVKRRKKKDKDDLAKAQLAVRRGDHDPDKDRKLEQIRSEEVGQTKVVNDAANKLKQRDGNSSILAQELYERDSSYRAKVHIVQLQERTRETGQRLEAAKETLKITGVDGEELSYDQIRKPSDMAAWTAKFEAQDIRNNFGNVSAEGFSLYVNEGYTNIINQHSNTWATSNANAQKKERLLTEQNVIMQSFNDGNFINAASDALYSKSLTPDQLYDLMLTGVESGAVSQNTLDQFMTEVPHTGGGTTTLSKLIGLQNYAELIKAHSDKQKRLRQDRQAENAVRVKERIAQIRMVLIDDPDGVKRKTLEEERIKLIRMNGGHAVPEMDEIIENYSAEKIAEANALDFNLDKAKEEISFGTFDLATLKNYPTSVADKLRAYIQQQPNYKQKSKQVKAHKEEIDGFVDTQAGNLPDNLKAKGTALFKQSLLARYEAHLQNEMSPQMAFEEVMSHAADKVDPKKNPGFLTDDGFMGMFRKTDVIKAEVIDMDSRLRYGKGKILLYGGKDMDREAVLQTKNALYSDTMLKIKVNQLRLGRAEFDMYDNQMAKLLGYTHPATMFKDILDRNPVIVNGEPLMFEPPPILELAENLLTPEQQRLFNSDIISAKRAFSMQTASTGLPVKVKANAQESEMLNYMTNEIGMSQFHALGLLVNGIRESSLHTSNPGDGGTSDGMFQWHAGRLTRARAALGGNWNDWRSQIKYALEEEGEPGQEYLQQQFSSAQEAADWWMRRWERPADQVSGSQFHKDTLRNLQY